MVPGKLSSIHRVQVGDSLRSVAAQFGLSSWLALARAPGNERTSDIGPDSMLPEGAVLLIPPKARDLLKQRMYVLATARQSLQRGFEQQDSIFERDIDLRALTDIADAEAIRATLGNLQAHAAAAIAEARLACQPLALINSGLALTHLHADADLALYVREDPGVAGLGWLLEPELVSAWSGMWAIELWSQRWQGCDADTALERASVYKNVIRSKVLQRVDRRTRETIGALGAVDAEPHAG